MKTNNPHLSFNLIIMLEEPLSQDVLDVLDDDLQEFDGCATQSINPNTGGAEVTIFENVNWKILSTDERVAFVHGLINTVESLLELDSNELNAELFDAGRPVSLECEMTRDVLSVLFKRCWHVSASLGSKDKR